MSRDPQRLHPSPAPSGVGTTGVRQKGPTSEGAQTVLVLVVADVDRTRDLYATYLGLRGLRVAEEADGERAALTACELRPDVIVVDLHTQPLDGWAAMRLLKSRSETRDIPVVVVGGSPDEEQRTVGEGGARNADVDPRRSEQVCATILAAVERAASGSP